MLVQNMEVIREGKALGEGMVVRYRTRSGTEIYGLGVPLFYSSGDWDLGPTWCYLIRGEQTVLIDTGQFDKFADLQSMLHSVGVQEKDIQHVVVTHGHEDHAGNLPEVTVPSGAKIWAHFAFDTMAAYHPGIDDGAMHPEFPGSCRCCLLPEEFNRHCLHYHAKLSRIKADFPVREGGAAPLQGLRFMLTPGHSPDSLCAVFEEEVLFGGDTLLATITPHPSLMLEYFANRRILPPGYGENNTAYGLMAYIGSLDRLQRDCRDAGLLLPAHRLFEKGRMNYLNPAQRAAEIIDFHKERCGGILRAMGQKVMGLEDISVEIFEPRLRKGYGKFMAQREVMSHLELLAVCGDIAWIEGDKFTSRATGSEHYRDYFRPFRNN